MSKEELATFTDFMPNYYDHCMNNKNSIITRVYGLYRIEWESLGGLALNIMIMSNIC